MAVRVVQRQDRAAPGDPGEDEATTVRLPAARRLDELQALEVRVHRGPGDLPIHLAGAPVGQEQVDREQVAVGQEHEPVTLRAQRGADVVAPVAVGTVACLDQAHPDAVRRLGVVLETLIGLGSRGVPLLHQLIRGDGQDAANRLPDVSSPNRRAEQVPHDRVAPSAGHVGEQGVAIPVGEEPRILELPERRKRVLEPPAHAHGGLRRLRT
jgi:hypothetical protein